MSAPSPPKVRASKTAPAKLTPPSGKFHDFRDLCYASLSLVIEADAVDAKKTSCTIHLLPSVDLKDPAIVQSVVAVLEPQFGTKLEVLPVLPGKLQLLAAAEATTVISRLVPTLRRAEGFNQFVFFTDWRFMPQLPDYISVRQHSFHVQYSTRTHRRGPLAGVKRYINTKSKCLKERTLDWLGKSVECEAEIVRPNDIEKLLEEQHEDDSDNPASSDDDGFAPGQNKAKTERPLYTGIALDGDLIGFRMAKALFPMIVAQLPAQ